jgi:hypothetical protein
LRAEETLKAQHRFGDAFYQPVILLNNIVEVLALAKYDPFRFFLVVLPNSRCIRATLIDVD